jgi:hypothetical protein
MSGQKIVLFFAAREQLSIVSAHYFVSTFFNGMMYVYHFEDMAFDRH